MISYTNPVLPGTNPDPSVCRGADAFYLVTSSFSYFPGLPIYRSSTLFSWELVGHGLTRPSQLDFARFAGKNEIFAPTIRYHRGRYYIVTTDVGGRGNFLISATNPAGPWSDPLDIDQRLFDPSLLFDGDTVYYTRRGPRGIDQAEINVATGRLTTQPREIAVGFCSKDAEGPHLYRIGDWYYLLMAEGGSRYGHMATVARSRSPWGPFEASPYNPLITQRHVTFSPIRDTGHAELIRNDAGAWWLFCLGTRNFSYGSFAPLGRETFLSPIAWTSDGWPLATNTPASDGDGDGNDAPRPQTDAELLEEALDPHDGRRIYPLVPWPETETEQPERREAPRLGEVQLLPWPADNDDGDTSGWYRYKRSDRGYFRVADRVAHGAGTSLDTEAGRHERELQLLPESSGEELMLLRKQRALFCSLFVDVIFDQASLTETGVVLFLDERHLLRLTLRPSGAAIELVLRRRIGDVEDAVTRSLGSNGHFRLTIEAEDERYTLFAAPIGDAGEAVRIGSIESRYLSPETAESWTGVFWGPYTKAGAMPPRQSPPARFSAAGERIHPREAHWWRITGDIPTHIQ